MLADKNLAQTSLSVGDLYPYKNDPRQSKKGIYVTNVRTYNGGFIPLLDSENYTDRKSTINNMKMYNYDDKIHHGARPLHQTTFDLNYQPIKSDFVTSNQMVFLLFSHFNDAYI
jgi:hypothetical protein